jgi:hypothetical protein
LFERTYCDHTAPGASDDRLLGQADRTWRDLVAAQPPLEPDPALVRELDRIVAAARRDLLAPA